MTNHEKEGYEIGVQLILLLCVVLHIAHHYYYDHLLFKELLTTVPKFEQGINFTINMFNKSLGIFANPFVNKIVILFLMVLHGIGSKGVMSPNIKKEDIVRIGTIGFFGYLMSIGILFLTVKDKTFYIVIHSIYILMSTFFLLYINKASQYAARFFSFKVKDIFNDENETFPQNEQLKGFVNKYSIHFQSKYFYRRKWRVGYINVVNPFRSTMVLGTPGSGKSATILEPAIWQSIWKGYATYVYDFKYPTLTKQAYNAYIKSIKENPQIWKDEQGEFRFPEFYVINFDDVEYSHRCNPLHKDFLKEVLDANESASTIMLNLNRSWAKEQGSFFPESAINYTSIIIWYLRTVAIKYEKKLIEELAKTNPDAQKVELYRRFSNVCTFPHVIELAAYKKTNAALMVFSKYPDLEIMVRPFMVAVESGAGQQLAGQIASAQIAISKLSSPTVYWVMTGDEFTLDINNPLAPKILCCGNNPERIAIYGTIFSLYTSRLIKLINKQGKRHSALFWDELPTMFIKGLDLLIATARSNRVATWLGIQDFSQLYKDYGKEEADVILGIQGNVFSGQVVYETANKLSERFGRTNQEKESVTFSQNDTSVQVSQELQNVIPASKISELEQGQFVGIASGSYGEETNFKKFNANILLDPNIGNADEPLPKIKDFKVLAASIGIEINSSDELEKFKEDIVRNNFLTIKKEVTDLIEYEQNMLLTQTELDFVNKKLGE